MKLKPLIESVPPRLTRWRDYAVGLALGLCASYANATILAPRICSAFRQLAGNDLYSILAGVGLAGLLYANSLDEGDNKVKTSAIRIGIATTGLINLENITTLFTGTPWGC